MKPMESASAAVSSDNIVAIGGVVFAPSCCSCSGFPIASLNDCCAAVPSVAATWPDSVALIRPAVSNQSCPGPAFAATSVARMLPVETTVWNVCNATVVSDAVTLPSTPSQEPPRSCSRTMGAALLAMSAARVWIVAPPA
jgi:hypothetical protein